MKILSREQIYPYAWPGGYPLVYFERDTCNREQVVCPACALAHYYQWLAWALYGDEDLFSEPYSVPTQGEIHYEGPPIECDECGTMIESAYGDPEEDSDDDGADGEEPPFTPTEYCTSDCYKTEKHVGKCGRPTL